MFRLLLHAIAYILFHQIRLELPDQLKHLSVLQLRRQFINVPVQSSEDRLSMSIKVSATYHRAREFRLASKRSPLEHRPAWQASSDGNCRHASKDDGGEIKTLCPALSS